MRKLLVIISLMIIILIPYKNVQAKKITCNNGNYSVTLELQKEIIKKDDTTIIAINSEYSYDISYKVVDSSIVSVSNNGIVTGLKDGNTKINVEVNFLEDNAIVESCRADLSIEVVSNNSYLKKLNIDEFDISEEFNKDKYEYNITLPYNIEKINIIAEADNEYAKVTGSGRRYINEGSNEYEIIVTATDGTTSTYKIIVDRAPASDDSSLQSLIVEGYVLNPKFNKDTYKYNLSIDKEVESITIKAVPTFKFATVKGVGKYNIASGDNVYYINVMAENSTNSVYEINIHKNNGSGKLKSLEISEVSLDEDFTSDKYIYHVTVKSMIDKLDIKALAYDDDKIEILGNDKLEYGENEIIIKVTNKDKSTTTYKIVVNKLSNEEEKERERNNKLLKILLIMFIGAIIFMSTSIGIFIRRNIKRKRKK